MFFYFILYHSDQVGFHLQPKKLAKPYIRVGHQAFFVLASSMTSQHHNNLHV